MQNYIYVLSASGKPLMPTIRTGHVGRLLNAGEARIVCHAPFVIQLKYDTPEEVQPLFGGTDSGRTNIGEAALSSSGDVALKAHVETNNKDVDQICQLLPVTDWMVEINRFAFMAMDNSSLRVQTKSESHSRQL